MNINKLSYIDSFTWSWLYGSWIYNYLCHQCYHH